MQKIRQNWVVICLLFFLPITCFGQNALKLKKPKTIVVGTYSFGIATTGYLYSTTVKGLTNDELNSISINGLSNFDRKAIDNYSTIARNFSDVSLLATTVMPNLLSLHSKVRNDIITYNVVYGQALLSTVGQVMLLKGLTQKNRPFVYNNSVANSEKLERDARFSFPSGHTAIAATASCFFATTYSLYFPESKYKKWVWAGAVIAPLITGYLRFEAGKHFVSDIIGGYAIGAANGIVFPLLFRIGK